MAVVWCDDWDRISGSDEEDTMKLCVIWCMIWIIILAYHIGIDHKDIKELRARINAIEATVEPLAYFSVDFDNRLAKAEGAWRMEEEDDSDGK